MIVLIGSTVYSLRETEVFLVIYFLKLFLLQVRDPDEPRRVCPCLFSCCCCSGCFFDGRESSEGSLQVNWFPRRYMKSLTLGDPIRLIDSHAASVSVSGRERGHPPAEYQLPCARPQGSIQPFRLRHYNPTNLALLKTNSNSPTFLGTYRNSSTSNSKVLVSKNIYNCWWISLHFPFTGGRFDICENKQFYWLKNNIYWITNKNNEERMLA